MIYNKHHGNVFFVPGPFFGPCVLFNHPNYWDHFLTKKKALEFCRTFGSDRFGLEGVTKGPPTSAKNSATPGRVEESQKGRGLFWGGPFFCVFGLIETIRVFPKIVGFPPQIIHF